MPTLKIEMALVLNKKIVPTEPKTLYLYDPYELASSSENLFQVDDELEVNLVHFKATGDLSWVERAFQLPLRWWSTHSREIPLLLEITELIRSKKPKGIRPKEPNTLLLVEVRERILVVGNNPGFVTLALTGHPGVPRGSFEDQSGVLMWFVEQLHKDVKVLLGRSERASGSKGPRGEEDYEHQDLVDEGIERLQANPQTKKVFWLPSRQAFKVIKADKRTSEFRVNGLTKRRRGSESECFDKALTAALQFLNGPEAVQEPQEPVAAVEESSA